MAEEEEKKPPTFGSATAFGGEKGFGGFAAAAAQAARDATSFPSKSSGDAAAEEEDQAAEEGEEEECKAEFQPLVQLDEVATSTGEEDEDVFFQVKAKLYRFNAEDSEWKERGVGMAKLLQHRQSKKIRMLMRRDKTLKICANHFVVPTVKMQEHTDSDKAWVFSTHDYADQEGSFETFCIRFGSPERANEFKEKYEEAGDLNRGVLEQVKDEQEKKEDAAKPSPEAEKLAEDLEKSAKVDDKAE
eukprot:CAMPEP_0113926864 /NCGR_PEP_ID=MMETSP1159-20121227/3992_1 /TAXON_ID=88271 /ORGANISM="Picocystis salinarum" /LENGTH=244 /DNA_ID=CAMNT_0000927305 /DNA_START=26 /DNA_END=760 /DNA_ORIENTATION=- /assembly_acc=CAM_ASM_000767